MKQNYTKERRITVKTLQLSFLLYEQKKIKHRKLAVKLQTMKWFAKMYNGFTE